MLKTSCLSIESLPTGSELSQIMTSKDSEISSCWIYFDASALMTVTRASSHPTDTLGKKRRPTSITICPYISKDWKKFLQNKSPHQFRRWWLSWRKNGAKPLAEHRHLRLQLSRHSQDSDEKREEDEQSFLGRRPMQYWIWRIASRGYRLQYLIAFRQLYNAIKNQHISIRGRPENQDVL